MDSIIHLCFSLPAPTSPCLGLHTTEAESSCWTLHTLHKETKTLAVTLLTTTPVESGPPDVSLLQTSYLFFFIICRNCPKWRVHGRRFYQTKGSASRPSRVKHQGSLLPLSRRAGGAEVPVGLSESGPDQHQNEFSYLNKCFVFWRADTSIKDTEDATQTWGGRCPGREGLDLKSLFIDPSEQRRH